MSGPERPGGLGSQGQVDGLGGDRDGLFGRRLVQRVQILDITALEAIEIAAVAVTVEVQVSGALGTTLELNHRRTSFPRCLPWLDGPFPVQHFDASAVRHDAL